MDNQAIPVYDAGQTSRLKPAFGPFNKSYFEKDLCFNKDVGARFGRRLRDLRKQHHLTQNRMAVKFGIDRSYISDVERGKKSASLSTLEIFALGFKITLSDLFRGL